MPAVITQNIDGLHQASGIPAEQVIELHGNGTYATCLACDRRHELDQIRARHLPRSAPRTKRSGATLVIVNRESTPLDDDADLVIRGEIGAALEAFIVPNRHTDPQQAP